MSPRTRKTPEAAPADTSETAAPKRRGRPPKAASAPEAEVAVAAPETESAAPKRRGRPPKSASAAAEPAEGAVPASKKRASTNAKSKAKEQAEAATDRPERDATPSRAGEERADGDGRDGDREARTERPDRIDGEDRDEQGDRADRADRSDRGGREERGRRGRRGGGQRRVGFNFRDLQGKILPELHLLAKEVGLEEYRAMEKDELVLAVLERVAESEGLRVVQGYLEISSDGYGFLQESLLQNNTRSVIVSAGLIKQFRLRTGDMILGKARRPRDNERYGTLIRVEAVNGVDPFQASKRPKFDDLIPTFPDHKITLETGQQDLSARVIDLLAPIGRGQRGLIVAPPKAGKTTLLKAIAKSVVTN